MISMVKDPYLTLGVGAQSEMGVIKRAHRELVKQHHPDTHPGEEVRFREIQEAYEILTDPKKKEEWEAQHQTRNLLEDYFVRSGEPLAGEDIRTSFTLTLAEAMYGRKIEISFRDMLRCTACEGLGINAAAGLLACSKCGGNGRIVTEDAIPSVVPCYRCGGSGQVAAKVCEQCAGQRFVMGQRSVRVRIPPSVYEGQTLRMKKKGREGVRENGDLFLTLHVTTPVGYKKREYDLIAEKKISVTEAVLGGEVDIEEPLGKTLKVRIPPSSSSGKMIRIRGYGMTAPKAERGALYVRLQIRVPDDLSHKERQLYLELAALEQEKEEGVPEEIGGEDEAEET